MWCSNSADNATPFNQQSVQCPAIKPESSWNRHIKNEPNVEDTLMTDAESSADASNNQQSTRDRDNA